MADQINPTGASNDQEKAIRDLIASELDNRLTKYGGKPVYESEAIEVVKAQVNRLLSKYAAVFFAIFGIANVIAFCSLSSSIHSAAVDAAKHAATDYVGDRAQMFDPMIDGLKSQFGLMFSNAEQLYATEEGLKDKQSSLNIQFDQLLNTKAATVGELLNELSASSGKGLDILGCV